MAQTSIQILVDSKEAKHTLESGIHATLPITPQEQDKDSRSTVHTQIKARSAEYKKKEGSQPKNHTQIYEDLVIEKTNEQIQITHTKDDDINAAKYLRKNKGLAVKMNTRQKGNGHYRRQNPYRKPNVVYPDDHHFDDPVRNQQQR